MRGHIHSFLQRRLRKFLGISGAKTRVLKVLALFIESGSVYCIVLVIGTFCKIRNIPRIADKFTGGGPHISI